MSDGQYTSQPLGKRQEEELAEESVELEVTWTNSECNCRVLRQKDKTGFLLIRATPYCPQHGQQANSKLDRDLDERIEHALDELEREAED